MTYLRLTSFVALLGALLSFTTALHAQDAYRIQPGDILRIEVIEDPDLNRSVLVSPDGRISLPIAGAIRARGQSIEQIQATLIARLSGSFTSPPSVFVAVERLAEVPPPGPLAPPEPDPVVAVFVMGEAKNAGKVEVTPGTTLLQTFAQFGGFTNFAATKRIQLRRGTEVYEINYEAILSGTDTLGDIVVAEGDVIVIPQRRLFE